MENSVIYGILHSLLQNFIEIKEGIEKGRNITMLNYLWGFMIVIGIMVGLVTGNTAEVSEVTLTSAKEAVSLCITMLGVMSFWCGLMEVAKAAGIMEGLSKAMTPVLKFLFPHIPKGHPALEHISANMIANLLGLGWAATPAGLLAMKELKKLEEERRQQGDKRARKEGIASNEMCTFLIINISSLQLIPVNIIAYRSQYGSVNPTAVIGPALVATLVSTVVAAGYCRVKEKLL
jgi:spore maturation protein A